MTSSPLDSVSIARLAWPILWAALAVAAWCAACLRLDDLPARQPGQPSLWRRALPFLGPLVLMGLLQLGSRATGLAWAALLALAGLIVVGDTDIRSVGRSLMGGRGRAFDWRSLRATLAAWLAGPAAAPGQAATLALVRKNGTPFGSRDVGAESSLALRRTQEILGRAVAANATDVHFEPKGSQEVLVRFRIDGMMQAIETLPAGLGQAVVSILKVVADMDIGERRRPQDGGFVVVLGPRRIDVRAATAPTNFGEKAALRLLDAESGIIQRGLDGLGMPPAIAAQVREVVSRSQGLLLVCGPTGSGKTTTIYGALQEMDALTRNIVTIEDPIEYRLENISQTAVNNAADLGFATILRSVLRQDPDVVLVGEIRDRETAEIAMQAALTGHLVLSTLHANDTATTITRLIDIGIDATLIQSTVTAVLAQRLLRVLCPDCKVASPPPDDFLQANRIPRDKVDVIYREAGCGRCLQTGYRGRTGVYEFLPITGALRSLLVGRPSLEVIRAAAAKEGLRSLRQAAVRKVLEGVTSIAEVRRVTT